MKVRFAICAFFAAAGSLLLMGAAHAQTTDNPYAVTPTSVVPTGGFTGGETQPAVEGVTHARVTPTAAPAVQAASALPFTGGDVAGLAVIGVLLVGGGVVLVRRNRSRSAA